MQTSDISFLQIRRFGDKDIKAFITKCYNGYNNCIIVHFQTTDTHNCALIFFVLKLKKNETVEVIMISDIMLCNNMSFFEIKFYENSANPLHNIITNSSICVMVSAKHWTKNLCRRACLYNLI